MVQLDYRALKRTAQTGRGKALDLRVLGLARCAALCGQSEAVMLEWIRSGRLSLHEVSPHFAKLSARSLAEFLLANGLRVPSELVSPDPQVIFVLQEGVWLHDRLCALSEGMAGWALLVDSAGSASQARVKWMVNRPDVLVVDMQALPHESIQLLEIVKRYPEFQTVRTVALTGARPRDPRHDAPDIRTFDVGMDGEPSPAEILDAALDLLTGAYAPLAFSPAAETAAMPV